MPITRFLDYLALVAQGDYPPFFFLLPYPYLFFGGHLVAFGGAIVLLLRPMTLERKGIVGFITFISSLYPLLQILLYTLWLTTDLRVFPP